MINTYPNSADMIWHRDKQLWVYHECRLKPSCGTFTGWWCRTLVKEVAIYGFSKGYIPLECTQWLFGNKSAIIFAFKKNLWYWSFDPCRHPVSCILNDLCFVESMCCYYLCKIYFRLSRAQGILLNIIK